jgi:predicted Fe-S protein YdhL (DUF1289 family)
VTLSESQSIVLISSMSFMVVEDLLIGFSPAVVDGSCPFAGLSMPPTEEDLVLIGGGGSGGCFAIWRLDIVGSEGIKLVCNGENGRRTETQSEISIRRIVNEWKELSDEQKKQVTNLTAQRHKKGKNKDRKQKAAAVKKKVKNKDEQPDSSEEEEETDHAGDQFGRAGHNKKGKKSAKK